MPEITLVAEIGRTDRLERHAPAAPRGQDPRRRLRPRASTPLAVAVDGKAFRQALSGEQGLNTLLDLVAGKKHYLVLAREIQRHPVRGTVNHVDFQVVSRTQGVEVEVPLEVIGRRRRGPAPRLGGRPAALQRCT